jgi:biopolymer transport protein ExbD
MAKFDRKGKDEMPKINTSSLPDVIFMILFFFMVVTTLRETDKMLSAVVPEATEITKLERKDLTSYIYIGTPIPALQAKLGTNAAIQLNDKLVNHDELHRRVPDIANFIVAEREKLSEVDRQFMVVSLKVDQNVRMGIVTDVKQELRRSSALKINYSARKPSDS